jgi:hypothetical protein
MAEEVELARAEGNPFFVEELVASLIDRGALTRANGGWALTADLDEVSIPDSVRGVLAARIDLLPAGEKAAPQAAAVIGRVFWERAVLDLLEADEVDLALLEDRDFVRRRPGSSMPGDREYAVKHALTREGRLRDCAQSKARAHACCVRELARAARGT